MIASERIEFDDGQWWQVRTKMSHGMQRAIQQANPQALRVTRTPEAPGALPAPDITIDWERYDFQAANEAMLLSATVAWSYGAVTKDVLDEIPEEQYQQVLARVDELYSSNPLAQRNGAPLLKTSS